jgi:hypothetical protein
MTEKGNAVRAKHWAVKLSLTGFLGGLLALGATLIPNDALAVVMPRNVVGPLCAAILVVSTTTFATVLYQRERNGWRRSLLMGVVIGVVASGIIILAVFMMDMLFDWLFSLIRLG